MLWLTLAGLAMVWNPTNRTVAQTLQAPLYYSGLTTKADRAVLVAQEGGEASRRTASCSPRLKPRPQPPL